MTKILIAFYSRSGKTAKAANDIARHLGADVEEIIDMKNRKGIFGFIFGGRDAMKKKMTELAPAIKNPADYDLVIVGSPIWGSNIAPAVRTYLDRNKNKFRQYAFFITSGDTDPALAVSSAAEVVGRSPIAFTGWNAKELAVKLTYEEKLALFVNTIKGNL